MSIFQGIEHRFVFGRFSPTGRTLGGEHPVDLNPQALQSEGAIETFDERVVGWLTVDRQSFAGEHIQERQRAEARPVLQRVRDEVYAPGLIRRRRLQLLFRLP